MTKTPITLTADSRREVRHAVELAVRYWPNSHLGDYTPREDIRSAFRLLRSHAERDGIAVAAAHLQTDAYRYADM